MIVALCGAYRNAGDHLIGARARALLRVYVDSDIVTVDRKSITPEHYELFNKADYVLLCGGPAYQREVYPKIYPLEWQRVRCPIVPFGLGWKAPVGMSVEDFRFSPKAEGFIRDIHGRIGLSSARDPLTVRLLNHMGIRNAAMTGCPAWYDLNRFEIPYRFRADVRTLVLSTPAVMQPGVTELMHWLTGRFPRARRIVTFHHGIFPSSTPQGRRTAASFLRFSGAAVMRGWRVVSLAGDLAKMEACYRQADLHIGYRVHAHLCCLSQRIASILICEDIRGVGQAEALGSPVLRINGTDIEAFQAAVEDHFETRGAAVERSVQVMRDTFPEMQRFLATLQVRRGIGR